MKFYRFLFSFTLLLMFCPVMAQQQNTPPEEEDKSLASQFQELERKSGNHRANNIRYEVIKLSELNSIKANIFDSINTANSTIKSLSTTIANNKTQIDNLNTKLKETTNSLKNSIEEKDSISFFGKLVSKGTYKFIIWSIIIVLLLLLLFFIYKFRNSNYLTHQAKTALADLENEYENHRRRALEREQKINRQLQDELNKQKNK